MEIHDIKFDLIVPYWNNPRNNEKAVKGVEESIQKYGFNQPLVVIEKDGKYEIVVGHTRYYALQSLSPETAPCVVVDLPEDKVKQYRIADNKIAEFSSWDTSKLIRELQTMEQPRELEAFFADGSIERMIGDFAVPKAATSPKPVQEINIVSYEPHVINEYVSENRGEESNTYIEGNSNNTANGETVEDTVDEEKANSEFQKTLEKIRNEQEKHNRSYKTIVCPNCGAEFIVKDSD